MAGWNSFFFLGRRALIHQIPTTSLAHAGFSLVFMPLAFLPFTRRMPNLESTTRKLLYSKKMQKGELFHGKCTLLVA
jgi:hypothetical protein